LDDTVVSNNLDVQVRKTMNADGCVRGQIDVIQAAVKVVDRVVAIKWGKDKGVLRRRDIWTHDNRVTPHTVVTVPAY
jgi:hypothetical protein